MSPAGFEPALAASDRARITDFESAARTDFELPVPTGTAETWRETDCVSRWPAFPARSMSFLPLFLAGLRRWTMNLVAQKRVFHSGKRLLFSLNASLHRRLPPKSPAKSRIASCPSPYSISLGHRKYKRKFFNLPACLATCCRLALVSSGQAAGFSARRGSCDRIPADLRRLPAAGGQVGWREARR